MDSRKRVIGYVAQRGIIVDLMGSYGVTSKLTFRQQRRHSKALRTWMYGKTNATAPF